MILGNLYRQKGQVGRAINVHQALLQRTDLRTLEHAYVLLCLGLDFRHGGFVDRALEAFQEVVRLDPRNRYAFVNLQKLYEDQQQWAEAPRVREQIAGIDAGRHAGGPADPRLPPQRDRARLRRDAGDVAGRGQDLSATRSTSTRHGAGLSESRRRPRATGQPRRAPSRPGKSWSQAVPERALSRVRAARARVPVASATPRRFVELCQQLIARDPQDWRARLALSRHLAAGGQHGSAFDLLLDALPHNPHGLAIHQEVWQALSALGLDAGLVRRYVDLTRDAVFYLDPHVCVRCRYRSTELLWQCPQCHEWNTFVEERIAPAKDTSVAELSES